MKTGTSVPVSREFIDLLGGIGTSVPNWVQSFLKGVRKNNAKI